MRRHLDRAKLEQFMQELGRRAAGPGTVYLTGGATALLLGFREQTIDVNIKLDPEPAGAFEAIAEIKNLLSINVELASPDQFLPPLPGWQERSAFIAQFGHVEFRHYDYYSQALAKIERGYEHDLLDALSFVAEGLVNPKELTRLANEILPQLSRYPGIDRGTFEAKLTSFLSQITSNNEQP